MLGELSVVNLPAKNWWRDFWVWHNGDIFLSKCILGREANPILNSENWQAWVQRSEAAMIDKGC